MDAYTNYITKLTDARVGELRKEAAEYALSRAARHRQASLWTRARGRLLGPRYPAIEIAGPQFPSASVEAGLRRSA